MLVETELFAAPLVSAMLLPVKHYARPHVEEKSSNNGYTLLFSHGIGLHKECWEPVIETLLQHSCVRDAWSFDWPSHGEGAAVNSEVLNSRTDMMTSPEWAALIAAFIKAHEFSSESTIAIGHSTGTTAFVLSTEHFTTPPYAALILAEAVMIPRKAYAKYEAEVRGATTLLSKAISKRRERWPSREDALRWMSDRVPWRQWDQLALRLFVDHALLLESSDDTQVRLACPKLSEAAQHLDHEPHKRAQDVYYSLGRAGVPVHFIFGGMPGLVPKFQRDAILDTSCGAPPAASVQVIPNAGHLIVQERPDELAFCISNLLTGIQPGPTRVPHMARL